MNIKTIETDLNKLLSNMEPGMIDGLTFDILSHSVSFKVTLNIGNNVLKRYAVVFNEISSFYFLAKDGNDRFNLTEYDPEDFSEVSLTGFEKEGMGKIMFVNPVESWISRWHSSANFVIEIWGASLFIEAKSITINEKTFEVGYPTKYG